MCEHEVCLRNLGRVLRDEERCLRTCALAGFNVADGVADHPATRDIDVPFLSGLKEHCRGGLAVRGAFLQFGRVVDVIELDLGKFMHPALELGVEMEQRILRHDPFADTLLIRDHDREIPTLFHRLHRLRNLFEQFELIPRAHIATVDASIDDAIAIEEDSLAGVTGGGPVASCRLPIVS